MFEDSFLFERLLEFTDMVVFRIIFINFCVIPKLFFKITLNTFEIRFVSLFYSLIRNILSLTFNVFQVFQVCAQGFLQSVFRKAFLALLFSSSQKFQGK